MAEIHDQGTVVEARPDLLVLSRPSASQVEETFVVKPHDAVPGDYVWIYDDGQVEVKNRPSRLPENVTEKTFPTSIDPDHS
jgi:hypothetical protein